VNDEWKNMAGRVVVFEVLALTSKDCNKSPRNSVRIANL
jgi:hypothetical protein